MFSLPRRPGCRSGDGVILNNSSVGENIPKPKYQAYSVGKDGILANAVGPAAVVASVNRAWIDSLVRNRLVLRRVRENP